MKSIISMWLLVSILVASGQGLVPGRVYAHGRHRSGGHAKPYECAICYEDVPERQARTLSCACNQLYCAPCIRNWLAQGSGCPVCHKTTVTMERIVPVASGNHISSSTHSAQQYDTVCTICQEETSRTDRYTSSCSCKYAYHYHCIHRWFTEKHSCPTCRKTGLSIVDLTQTQATAQTSSEALNDSYKHRYISCGICFKKLSKNNTYKMACSCHYAYHHACLYAFLSDTYQCPTCGQRNINTIRVPASQVGKISSQSRRSCDLCKRSITGTCFEMGCICRTFYHHHCLMRFLLDDYKCPSCSVRSVATRPVATRI